MTTNGINLSARRGLTGVITTLGERIASQKKKKIRSPAGKEDKHGFNENASILNSTNREKKENGGGEKREKKSLFFVVQEVDKPNPRLGGKDRERRGALRGRGERSNTTEKRTRQRTGIRGCVPAAKLGKMRD